jgi:hypothetical protein
MSIPQAVPSQLSQLICSLSAKASFDHAATLITCAEAGFYSRLKGGLQHTTKLMTWVQETCIAQIHKIQFIFNAASCGLIAYNTVRLIQEIETQLLFEAVDMTFTNHLMVTVPVLCALGALTKVAVLIINRKGTTLAEEKKENGVTISETLSSYQKATKYLHSAQIVLNCALAIFSSNRVWFTVSLVSSSYSLLKNMNLKWISIKQPFRLILNNPKLPSIEVSSTYNMLVLPKHHSLDDQNCPICLTERTDMVFCAHHAFCQTCMKQTVINKIDTFVKAHISKIIKRFEFSVQKNDLPSCPECRQVPEGNDCKLQVTDSIRGTFNASFHIERPKPNRQYLFEKCYALYNRLQAGMTYLQTYPELAGTVFKIQKFMLATDLIGYSLTAYYLYGKVNQKFNPKNTLLIKGIILTSFVAVGVFAYFAVIQINAYLKPALLLKNILSELNIDPVILKTLEIDWNSPLIHKALQFLYVNRIVAMAGLSLFSKSKANLLSLTTQTLSLFGISQLKWIEVTQTLDYPMKKIAAEGGYFSTFSFSNSQTIKKLKSTFHYLVDSSCTKDSDHLKTSVQSIYNHITKFFNNSSWSRYWEVTEKNGVEVSRSLIYDIFLKNHTPEHCGCSLTPTLTDCEVSLIDSYYGSADVRLTTG